MPPHHRHRPPPARLLLPAGQPAYERLSSAFVMELSHPVLDLRRMLATSGGFDEYDGVAAGHLIVTVMESRPGGTVLHVKPSQPLTFAEIAQEVDAMVARIGTQHHVPDLRVVRIAWSARPMGVPVRDRAGLRSIM